MHECSKDALPWNDYYRCKSSSVYKPIPPSADGFRDPELCAPDGVSAQVLPLYAAGTYAARACIQAERLYHGRETTVTSPGKGNTSGLGILESFPLSVLFDTSFTSLRSPQMVSQTCGGTAPSQNGSFEFLQQASLFLAGAWAMHVGSFVQVTYTSQGDHFTWDNSDIRYANVTKLFKKDLA